MLSKKEAKYRTKFIQECHYNKEEQRIFDEAHAVGGETYKKMYRVMRSGQVYYFMMSIANNRFGRIIKNGGISSEETTEAFATIVAKSKYD